MVFTMTRRRNQIIAPETGPGGEISIAIFGEKAIRVRWTFTIAGRAMNLDYLELEDGEFDATPVRRGKFRPRKGEESEFRGRKDRRSPRERIRRIRRSQERF